MTGRSSRRALPCCYYFLLLCSVMLLSQAQQRTLTFINYCSYPVWYGFVSGATGDNCGASCPSGSYCNSANNLCYWNLPTSDSGNYKLEPNATDSATVTVYSNGRTTLWSGAIAGRTGCVDNEQCETADCGTTNHDSEPCETGFQQPATQAEVTFLKQDQDTYDLTVINGGNIPVEMAADVTGTYTGYHCGNPGAVTPTNDGLGSCSWDFTAPSPHYLWVKAGGPSCSSNDDCPGANASYVCGLNAAGGNTQLTCGKLLGFYTPDQVCGVNSNFGAPFNCPANRDMYGCVGSWSESCYTDGAVPGCCGCVNWNTLGLQIPDGTTQCKAVTPTWTSTALPGLEWIKEGCPTLYTYPFDDPSSTFTCSVLDGGNNVVNYTISFCPRDGLSLSVTGSTNSPASSLQHFFFSSPE